jgi:hypothetical protein
MELRQCWADDNHAVSGAVEHFNPADALRAPLISGVEDGPTRKQPFATGCDGSEADIPGHLMARAVI